MNLHASKRRISYGAWIVLTVVVGCNPSQDGKPGDKVTLEMAPESSPSIGSPKKEDAAVIVAAENKQARSDDETTGGSSSPAEPSSGNAVAEVAEKPSSSSSAFTAPVTANVSDKSPNPQPPPDNVATNATDVTSTQATTQPELVNSRVDYRAIERPVDATAASWQTKDWVTYIATLDRATQSLLLDQQANIISPSDFSSEARRLGELKLEASESLMARSQSSMDQELGILGKIEALSQLAGLGDRSRANELLAFANKNSTFQSKEVARQTSLVLLGFSLNNLSGAANQPEVVLAQVDAVLADRDRLRLPEFKMMDQVVNVLRRNNLNDLANQVTERTIAAFKQNSDPNIAYTIWQMEMESNALFQDMLKEVRSTEPDPARVSQSMNAYFASNASDWALLWLSNEIRNVEFAGLQTSAGVIADFVDSKLSTFQSQAIKQIVTTELDAFKSHVSLLGKPLELQELATLDGIPLNLEQYRGKVVLVVYWASWCQTCRAEFPELVKLYDELKPSGFEIIGVNLDDSVSAMSGVLQVTQLPWVQVRSSNPNRIGIATLAASQVGLRATPFTILLDREGKVIALQLHGERLREQLTTLLQQP